MRASRTNRRPWLLAVGLALVACILTACTFSLPGGIAGIVMSIATGALLLGLGATQSGCEDRVSGCLSLDVGPEFGACLSPPLGDGIGPCLAALPPDGGEDGVGPCLGALPPDGGQDSVGPCLSPPAPDSGGKDAPAGPCLTPPPPDASARLTPRTPAPRPRVASLAQERAAAMDRLGQRLPADVQARLADAARRRS